jgi:hypothetical protein
MSPEPAAAERATLCNTLLGCRVPDWVQVAPVHPGDRTVPSEIVQTIPALPDVIITGEPTVHAIHQCLERALAGLVDARQSAPHVTVYVDCPEGTAVPDLDAALQTLKATYALSHLVIRVGDRPTIGNLLQSGDGRDPVVAAGRRAAARVASALMHAESLDQNDRLTAAFEVLGALAQCDAQGQLPWMLQQVATIGWRLGDHPIVRAGRVFGGLPPSVHDGGDFEDIDPSPHAFLPRCVALARDLGADPAQEERFQALDARAATLGFPDATVPWTDDAQMHTVFWGLAQRVLQAAQTVGEVVSEDAVGDLWSIGPTGEPMQDVCNFGAGLRHCIQPGSPDYLRDSLQRVSWAFDALGLACMGVHVNPGSRQRDLQVKLADGLLRYALAEIAVFTGRLESDGEPIPRQLPFWPYDARGASDPADAVRLQEALARVQAWLDAGQVEIPQIDGLRRLAAENGGSPHTRDLATTLHGLLDVCVLKLAHANGADIEQWLQASRQFELERLVARV